MSKNKSPIREKISSKLPKEAASLTANTVEIKLLDRGSELII